MLGAGGLGLATAALGGAAGALAGDRLAERLDPRGDLGRFGQIYHATPYFVPGMAWEDYRPAYRYGVALAQAGKAWDPEAFARDWVATVRRGSRLSVAQATPAAEHAHRHVRQGQPGTPGAGAGAGEPGSSA